MLEPEEGSPLRELGPCAHNRGDAAHAGLLAWLGIEAHIARRRTPHGNGMGKVRWAVERTISWLKGLRRLRIRYDRLMRFGWQVLLPLAVLAWTVSGPLQNGWARRAGTPPSLLHPSSSTTGR